MTKLIVAFRNFESAPKNRNETKKPIPIISPRKEGYKNDGSSGKGRWGKVALFRAVIAYRGSTGIKPRALDGDEYSTSRLGHFIPRERIPPTPVRIGQEDGWVTESVWTI